MSLFSCCRKVEEDPVVKMDPPKAASPTVTQPTPDQQKVAAIAPAALLAPVEGRPVPPKPLDLKVVVAVTPNLKAESPSSEKYQVDEDSPPSSNKAKTPRIRKDMSLQEIEAFLKGQKEKETIYKAKANELRKIVKEAEGVRNGLERSGTYIQAKQPQILHESGVLFRSVLSKIGQEVNKGKTLLPNDRKDLLRMKFPKCAKSLPALHSEIVKIENAVKQLLAL